MPDSISDIMPVPPAGSAADPEFSPDINEPEDDLPQPFQPPRMKRFGRWFGSRKKWTVPLLIALIVLILAVVPFSRYHLSSFVLKNDYSIRVLDVTTGLPVSGATVQAGKLTAQTDATGRATLDLPVGERTLSINKAYYRAGSFSGLVPILKQKKTPDFTLQATGRQVKITVRNLINKNPLADTSIEVAGINAATDKNGNALLVLPPGIAKQPASLSLSGYNDSKATVIVSDQKIQQNDLYMTPSGKVYFLAYKNGRLNVTKSNLDGSAAQVVAAGTGNEDPAKTYLSHSSDWKYLALLSKRDSGPAKLYVINTSDDQLLTMDQGNVSFSPLNWIGDYFIYKSDLPQAINAKYDQVTLKSYDAQTGRMVSIDQTSTQPLNSNTFLQSSLSNIYQDGGSLLYTKFWDRFGNYDPTNDLAGKTEYFYKINPDGSGRQTLRSFKATDYQWTIGKVYEPGKVHYQLGGLDASGKRKSYVYYDYSGGQLNENKQLSETAFNQSYPSYFASPAGANYFWSQAENGQNELFLSSQNNFRSQKIDTPTGFDAAGWFGNNYLLATKNSAALYIVGVAGGTPVKIADYQKNGVY